LVDVLSVLFIEPQMNADKRRLKPLKNSKTIKKDLKYQQQDFS